MKENSIEGLIKGWTMKIVPILFCAALAAAPTSAVAGTIQGTVVNTSTGAPVPSQVAVVLQVLVNGEFVPFRDVISDKQGRFSFQRLPLVEGPVYRAGATRHGIFYPGPRIALTELQPVVRTQLAVCDAVASPSPLVLKKMDITIRPETGLLKVTESLVIENPTHTCYVGDPVTLELSIPPDFERTTFDLEFFGRRFTIFNKKLVTNVPWQPGQRELRYTYVLHNSQEVLRWKRPLDMACSDVTVRIEGKSRNEVRCPMLRQTTTDEKAVLFTSAGQEIPAGQVLEVELGRLPLPWMTYGKWTAVAIMFGLITGAGWLHFRRRQPAKAILKTMTAQNKQKKAA